MISAVAALGEALGYAVEREYPVVSDQSNPPAVDVAWFAEKGQPYPLVIFEVESRASSGIANNALKVLGQDSSIFEKPLFFFHIVLSRSNSSRIAALERVFGTYNYRCFSFADSNSMDVMSAALTQHRRLRDQLHLGPLLECLALDSWKEISPTALVHLIDSLGFKADFVPVLAQRSLYDELTREAFIDWLANGGWSQTEHTDSGYQTYIGYHWSHLVHPALVADAMPGRSEEMCRPFDNWQSKPTTRIGPNFGLSRDYDEFLIGISPVFLALIADLMPTRVDVVLATMAEIRESLAPWAGFPNAIWALHLASGFDRPNHFHLARSHINDAGGVGENALYTPPGFFDLNGDETWPSEIQQNPIEVPDLRNFRICVRRVIEGASGIPSSQVAMRFLADDRYGSEPMNDLIAAIGRR